MDFQSFTMERMRSFSRQKEKWPSLFWILLMILGLFHHKSLVNPRKCFACHVKHIRRKKGEFRGTSFRKVTGEGFKTIFSLKLSYEGNDREEVNTRHRRLLEVDDEKDDCAVCASLWWDSDRQPCIYTEEEIGASRWNNRVSRTLSLFLLILLLSLSFYCIMFVVLKLRNQPGRTTELVVEITYTLFIVSNSFVVLCCKLRCIFKGEASLFQWSSMLNARYVIKRAQLLGLHTNGLPSKFFLFLCIFWPLINSSLRCVMFLSFTEPNEGAAYIRALLTCIVGLMLMQTWGIFAYVVYIVRVSFQRQFSLLLSFIEEHEGHIDLCRGVLLDVITDFAYFRRFLKVYISFMLPVAFVGMASNLSWGYLIDDGCGSNEDAVLVQTFISIVAWSQIIQGVFIFLLSQGAVDVKYLWDNFFSDVIKLHSDRYDHFWQKMIRCMSFVKKDDNGLFLVSVVFSVIGVYTALNIQIQDTSYLARGCNGTNETNYG